MRKGKTFLFFVSLAAIGFLYLWLTIHALSPTLPSPGYPPLLYSNQTRQDLQYTLLEAIDQAKESIHLVIFGLTDPVIVNALHKKSLENIDVQVFYDPEASLKLDRFLTHAKTTPVENVGLMHQKILVIDRKMIFLGSSNMTPTSLKMHDNLVMGSYSPPMAEYLIQFAPGDGRQKQFYVGGQTLDLWLLPDPRGHALYSIKKMIQEATQNIRIAMFTFTHPALVDDLIRAHRKGIQVTVVVDHQTSLGASLKAIELLKKSGVTIRVSQGIQLLHHKFMYIDDRTLVSGSANWTKSAFYNNHDCFITLHNLNSDQKQFMQDLWQRLEVESKHLE